MFGVSLVAIKVISISLLLHNSVEISVIEEYTTMCTLYVGWTEVKCRCVGRFVKIWLKTSDGWGYWMGLTQPSTAALKAVAVSAGDASITCTIIYTELYPLNTNFYCHSEKGQSYFFQQVLIWLTSGFVSVDWHTRTNAFRDCGVYSSEMMFVFAR